VRAVRPAEPHRLFRKAKRRSAEEAARVATDDLPAGRARHPSARRFRRVMRGDGPGPHEAGARPILRQIREREVRRQHKIVIVSLCGHNARCMFTSEVALPLLFPKVWPGVGGADALSAVSSRIQDCGSFSAGRPSHVAAHPCSHAMAYSLDGSRSRSGGLVPLNTIGRSVRRGRPCVNGRSPLVIRFALSHAGENPRPHARVKAGPTGSLRSVRWMPTSLHAQPEPLLQ
jgi:hypothetical protein